MRYVIDLFDKASEYIEMVFFYCLVILGLSILVWIFFMGMATVRYFDISWVLMPLTFIIFIAMYLENIVAGLLMFALPFTAILYSAMTGEVSFLGAFSGWITTLYSQIATFLSDYRLLVVIFAITTAGSGIMTFIFSHISDRLRMKQYQTTKS